MWIFEKSTDFHDFECCDFMCSFPFSNTNFHSFAIQINWFPWFRVLWFHMPPFSVSNTIHFTIQSAKNSALFTCARWSLHKVKSKRFWHCFGVMLFWANLNSAFVIPVILCEMCHFSLKNSRKHENIENRISASRS